MLEGQPTGMTNGEILFHVRCGLSLGRGCLQYLDRSFGAGHLRVFLGHFKETLPGFRFHWFRHKGFTAIEMFENVVSEAKGIG